MIALFFMGSRYFVDGVASTGSKRVVIVDQKNFAQIVDFVLGF